MLISKVHQKSQTRLPPEITTNDIIKLKQKTQLGTGREELVKFWNSSTCGSDSVTFLQDSLSLRDRAI